MLFLGLVPVFKDSLGAVDVEVFGRPSRLGDPLRTTFSRLFRAPASARSASAFIAVVV